jgi:hypothetical protein
MGKISFVKRQSWYVLLGWSLLFVSAIAYLAQIIIFRLAEELVQRKNFKGLPNTEYQHLAGDMKRVYGLLISEWLAYMEHLKSKYPYLFSLAIRMNPFDPDASPEVR